MFYSTPEFAPDLEWMLTSGQVDETTLMATLIRAHYSEIFNLGLVLNGIAPEAHLFAQQTLADAVLSAHQYKGKTSVRAWIFRLALSNYQIPARQPKTDENNSANHYLAELLGNQFSFNQAEIDSILNGRETTTQDNQVDPALPPTQDPLSPPSPAHLPPHGWTPSAQPENESERHFSEQEIAEISASIEAEIAKKRRVKNATVRFQVLSMVGVAVLLVAILIRVYPFFTAVLDPTSTPLPTTAITVIEQIEITATPPPPPAPTPFPPWIVVYTAHEGDSLEDVARIYGVSIHHLHRINDFPEDDTLVAGQQVAVGMGSSRYTWTTTPTPFSSVKLPEALTLTSDTSAIQRRVAESRRYWHTLWAEVQVRYFGPASYIGPPLVGYHQTWLDQTINSTLTLTGDLDGNVSLFDLRTDFSVHQYDFESGTRHSTTQTGFYYAFHHDIHNFLVPGRLNSELGLTPNLSVVDQYEVVGLDQVAGRDTLVVDWTSELSDYLHENQAPQTRDHGRYWIDTQLEVILRHQTFHPGEEPLVLRDYLVTDIVFDQVFPYSLFEPYQELPRRLAQDYRGEPLPHGVSLPPAVWTPEPGRLPPAQDPPPAGYTTTGSQLSFHFKPESALIDVYSDGYFLGGVKSPDPRDFICSRSPDGRLIALASSPYNPQANFTPMFWIDLHTLKSDEVNIPGSPLTTIQVFDFSFSSDSRRLAFFGCAGEANCGVNWIDLETGEHRWVMSLRTATYLNWSPDGNYLALLGSYPGGTHALLRTIVIDLATDQVVYNGEVDAGTGLPVPDSPTHEWGVPFASSSGNLDHCAAQPG